MRNRTTWGTWFTGMLVLATAIASPRIAAADEEPDAEGAPSKDAAPSEIGPEPLIHVRLRDTRARKGDVLLGSPNGWSVVCRALPCELDVPRRTPLRIRIGDEQVDVVIDGVPGVDEVVAVAPNDKGRRDAGTWFLISGGACLGGALVGVLTMAFLSAFDFSETFGGESNDRTAGWAAIGVLAGVGAGLMTTGIVLRTQPRSGVQLVPQIGPPPSRVERAAALPLPTTVVTLRLAF